VASSLLALLDDIATVLDDVALMTKVAARKTAGVLGDDLALNAQQVAGVDSRRELLVVRAVAKGSMLTMGKCAIFLIRHVEGRNAAVEHRLAENHADDLNGRSRSLEPARQVQKSKRAADIPR
jgi:hypothetical protein